MKQYGRYLFLIGFFWSSSFYGWAQNLCTGNLGENIFDAGDFGRGSSNILFPNPDIAAGYTYTNNGPPQDGFYTVTNNTAVWPGLFSSWLGIGDNSNDPLGYMMVVNASFSPGIFFEQTIMGLCENTTYEFSADIINLIRTGVANHGKPDVSFLLDGLLLYTTGEIGQTEQWNTYGFTFETQLGQTELKLTLRNNAPGGVGNDLALDNISFRACGPSAFINTPQNIFLCANDNQPAAITADLDQSTYLIQWQISLDQGVSWNDIAGENGQVFYHQVFTPGIYQYRYLSATSSQSLQNFKCRIISDVISIEVLPQYFETTDSICQNVPYLFGRDSLRQTGVYTANLISSRGCDSIVTLNLQVLDNQLDFDATATYPNCNGEADGSITFANIANAYYPVDYFLNGQLVAGPLVSDLLADIYDLQIVDRFQCSAQTSIDLLEPSLFTIDVGPDLVLAYGETSTPIQVTSSKVATSMEWYPKDFISCTGTDCDKNQIIGVSDRTYIISALDSLGCYASDTLEVTLSSDEIQIYIPNVFSPNGDGINDFFQLFAFGQSVANIESMTVFNRWGGIVYEGNKLKVNDLQSGWNGRIKDQWAEEGVYVYLFQLRLIDGRLISKSGSVMVLY